MNPHDKPPAEEEHNQHCGSSLPDFSLGSSYISLLCNTVSDAWLTLTL
jgi:hypothetical protein